VHGVSRRQGSSNDIEWHEVDLLERDAARRLVDAVRPSHLLHAAWFVHPAQYWISPENIPWVQSSLNLVEEFARFGGKRALLIGSCAEYDPRFAHCHEQHTPLGPASMYGACKASLGLILPHVAAAHGLASTAWARLFYVFGPHEDPHRLVPAAIRALLLQQPFDCLNAEQVRDPLVIEDAAEALVSVLDSNATGSINIGSGVGVALRELLERVAVNLARTSLLHLGQSGGRPGEAPVQIADVTRLTREVGWKPRFTLQQGIEQAVAWWRAELRSDV
jgi:nucleoside-diphosphate-sugar epimerase